SDAQQPRRWRKWPKPSHRRDDPPELARWLAFAERAEGKNEREPATEGVLFDLFDPEPTQDGRTAADGERTGGSRVKRSFALSSLIIGTTGPTQRPTPPRLRSNARQQR